MVFVWTGNSRGKKLFTATHRDYGVLANELQRVSKEYIFVEARRLSKFMASHHDRDESSHTPVAESSLGFRAKLADIV